MHDLEERHRRCRSKSQFIGSEEIDTHTYNIYMHTHTHRCSCTHTMKRERDEDEIDTSQHSRILSHTQASDWTIPEDIATVNGCAVLGGKYTGAGVSSISTLRGYLCENLRFFVLFNSHNDSTEHKLSPIQLS